MNTDLRVTSEMKIHDEVSVDDVRSRVVALAGSTATEGSHIVGHNYYVDEAQRVLFVHEHYTDSAAMLRHFGEMDQELVGHMLSAVDVLDLRIYGPATPELKELLGAYGSPRFFGFVSGFSH